MAFAQPSNIAKQVLAEFIRRGEVKVSSREEMAGRIEGYRIWLESYVAAILFEELGRLGRAGDYKIFADGDDARRDEFYRGLIPNYEEFLKAAMAQAVEALLGKPLARAAAPSKPLAAFSTRR